MERAWYIVWITEAAFERGNSAVETERIAVAAEDEFFGLPERDGFGMLGGQRRLSVYDQSHGAVRFMDGDDIVFMIQL